MALAAPPDLSDTDVPVQPLADHETDAIAVAEDSTASQPPAPDAVAPAGVPVVERGSRRWRRLRLSLIHI